ncbi:BRO family protein [Pseudomonas sp. DP-17]|uniref:BRO-N domain-containing protein n=1 Tax=Pseudomonas sp. DP-17 TaxID=1580486 RepID=UPI001EFBC5D8|nr:BRO family protein [Pseudomonas sp. DP-17]MCG8908462.1 hypothetical protein [Pseudomonas sp. DP-17]
MHSTYTPTFFTRHNRPLRGVMIDNQPWFAARDIARLVAYRFPHSIQHRFYPHEVRTVRLAYSTGSDEETVMLSEAALYKALLRFGHPNSNPSTAGSPRTSSPPCATSTPQNPTHPAASSSPGTPAG